MKRSVLIAAALLALMPMVRPAAADTGLPLKYSIIAPLYLGNTAGTTSYVRFFNGRSKTVYINLTVVGNKSGHVYGTANVALPQYSSPQYIITDILSAANVSGFVQGDDGYSLYLEDPENSGQNGYQHVIYNNNNGFFENASECVYHNNEIYEGINQVLINVHTSVLSDYPAYVSIHNYDSVPVSYTAQIVDARSGELIGQVPINSVAANTTYQVPFSDIERALHWTPRSNQEHANIIFTATNATYRAIVGQMIFNSRFGSFVNMTHYCAINHYDPSAVTN